MDEFIDSLGDTKIFSALDASAVYWQIEMEGNTKYKTDFVSHRGLFWYKQMPFELKKRSWNVLSCYQHYTSDGEMDKYSSIYGKRRRIFTDAIAAYGTSCYSISLIKGTGLTSKPK